MFKGIRPMYVFTVLALLLVLAMVAATRTPDLKPELEALLNTTIGGLITMIGVIVNFEFGAAKAHDVAAPPAGTSIDAVTTVATKTGPVLEPQL